MKVLAVNAGSSSLKYQLIDFETRHVIAKGLCERIGIDGKLIHRIPSKDEKHEFDYTMDTHDDAIKAVLDALVNVHYGVIVSADEIHAVGHRVAHGGEAFKRSTFITPEVMAALEECIALAPLHNHANITGIKACSKIFGESTPQVAVFDTAFHQTMPPHAYIYALPYEFYTEDKIRRYGFHGTSHRYVAGRAADLMGKPLESLKLISCHLGNGSSIAAIDQGKSVDTSMGFTPLAGLPMGTRSGDIDAGIMDFLMKKHEMSMEDMLSTLNSKSGVFGISGVSFDFRDIEQAAAEGNERAQLAWEVFTYGVVKYIGAYAAAMGGLDGVIFTAGVGENDSSVRWESCRRLSFMGINVDEAVNERVHGEETFISCPDSPVKVMVVPTDEELMIACDTAAIVEKM